MKDYQKLIDMDAVPEEIKRSPQWSTLKRFLSTATMHYAMMTMLDPDVDIDKKKPNSYWQGKRLQALADAYCMCGYVRGSRMTIRVESEKLTGMTPEEAYYKTAVDNLTFDGGQLHRLIAILLPSSVDENMTVSDGGHRQ